MNDCEIKLIRRSASAVTVRRGDLVDHRSIAQHGQVEAVAVERHELWVQVRDPVNKR